MDATEQAAIKDANAPVILVPPEIRDPGLPKGIFSHSQYISYLICGKAYEFKYVLGQRGPKNANMSRGSAIHKGVEYALKTKMLTGTPPPIEECVDVVTKSFAEHAKEVEDWGDTSEEAVRAVSVKAYEVYHQNAIAHINPQAIEKKFTAMVGTVPMLGYIDLIDQQPAVDVAQMSEEEAAEAPQKKVVVDLKTTRAAWSAGDLEKDSQLTLYAHVEGTPNVRVDQLVLLKKAPVFRQGHAARTSADTETFVEHLEEVTDFIKRGVFPKAPIDHWSCSEKHCAFWKDCRGKNR